MTLPLAFLLPLALSAAREWVVVDRVDEATIETRPRSGSAFDEIRITRHTKLPIKKLCDAVWGTGEYDPSEPSMKARKLLQEKNNERVAYEQVATPIVSDRDYTIWSQRLEDADSGLCQVLFKVRNDLGPPPAKGYVRMEHVDGSWTFEPDDDGTLITYVIYSDPGGSIPAFMAKGAQRKAALAWLKNVLAKASH